MKLYHQIFLFRHFFFIYNEWKVRDDRKLSNIYWIRISMELSNKLDFHFKIKLWINWYDFMIFIIKASTINNVFEHERPSFESFFKLENHVYFITHFLPENIFYSYIWFKILEIKNNTRLIKSDNRDRYSKPFLSFLGI